MCGVSLPLTLTMIGDKSKKADASSVVVAEDEGLTKIKSMDFEQWRDFAALQPYVPLESGRNVFAQPPTLTCKIVSAEGF